MARASLTARDRPYETARDRPYKTGLLLKQLSNNYNIMYVLFQNSVSLLFV